MPHDHSFTLHYSLLHHCHSSLQVVLRYVESLPPPPHSCLSWSLLVILYHTQNHLAHFTHSWILLMLNHCESGFEHSCHSCPPYFSRRHIILHSLTLTIIHFRPSLLITIHHYTPLLNTPHDHSFTLWHPCQSYFELLFIHDPSSPLFFTPYHTLTFRLLSLQFSLIGSYHSWSPFHSSPLFPPRITHRHSHTMMLHPSTSFLITFRHLHHFVLLFLMPYSSILILYHYSTSVITTL